MTQLSLEVVEGPDAGTKLSLEKPVVIGTDESGELVLHDRRASPRHARVSPSRGGALVEDLGSSNGTFVNHVQLQGPAEVEAGDDLIVGVSVLVFRTAADVAAQPTAPRPVPPALAAAQRTPTYVGLSMESDDTAPGASARPPGFARLLDVRVRAQARLAPLALLALVAFVLIIYFAATR